MTSVDFTEAYLNMQFGIESIKRTPYLEFTCSSDLQKRFLGELGKGEIYLHSGNVWGKTTIGARAGVALAIGLKELDGVTLPALPSPNIGIVLSLDYKQQRLSVQPKYLQAIGSHPHECEWNGETLVSIRIKPLGNESDDPNDWSLIMFMSQENRRSGLGARGHWCHADEPPREDIWREVRKMGEAGSIFVSYITATPLKRSQWYWLRKDYPLQYEGKWHNGYLRLRAETFSNKALTERDKTRLLRAYENDPLREARLLGKEIDTAGASPFRSVYKELELMHKEAKDGTLREYVVKREIYSQKGPQIVSETVEVEFWKLEPHPGHIYRLILDPSLGIDDGEHDPALLVIWDMTTGEQIARYSGYLGEYGCGALAGVLAREWNDAKVDIARTGGYGGQTLSGLRSVGYKNLVTRTVTNRKGIQRTDVGFVENENTRPEFVGAIREVLIAYRQGVSWLKINSRADIAELMDIIYDKKERPVNNPGSHDEVIPVIGRVATILNPHKKPKTIQPSRQKVPLSVIDRLRRDSHLPPRSIGIRTGRAKPRPLTRGY